ncbi:MAG: extracellular solute-binding protein [Mycoplasmatales bacterium]
MTKKIFVPLFIFAMLLVTITTNASTEEVEKVYLPYPNDESKEDYDKYKNSLEGKYSSGNEFSINAIDYKNTTDNEITVNDNVLSTSSTGKTSWEFDVKSDGLYEIELEYFQPQGKAQDIIRSISIDGNVPFEELNNINLKRNWENAKDPEFVNGNELQPIQVESPMWKKVKLEDEARVENAPFVFYLSKGNHEISLESIQEPLDLKQINFLPPLTIPTYEEYISKNNAQEIKDFELKIEAENAKYKSNSSLYPSSNTSDSSVSPNSPFNILMNVIGKNWDKAGQEITWEFEVPEAGFYNITTRFSQNFDQAMFSSRRLRINGQIPFEDANAFKFSYDKNFQTKTLSRNEENLKFYLNAGLNTISFEGVTGELGSEIKELEKLNEKLNDLYRKVIIITGTVPDKFRDYNIIDSIDGVVQELEILNNNLLVLKGKIATREGASTESTVVIDKLIRQINNFLEDPDNIVNEIGVFKSNISALPSLITNMKKQELIFDYIVISSPETSVKQEKKNIFSSSLFGLQRFIASFTNNQDNLSSVVEGNGDRIEVWITKGQDELQVWRSLIDNYFTPETGINVDLKLVGSKTILPAVLAGEGPDIATYLTQEIPVNFATRNAVVDLSKMEGFEEIKNEFSQSAVTPFEYNNGVFALPEEQKFPVMFYRKDIFDELNLEVPKTMEELYQTLNILSSKNMEMTVEPTLINASGGVNPNLLYSTLLYQHGGKFYDDNDKVQALTSDAGLSAFKEFTEFYTNYSVDIQVDFANRFKTGESPIGLMDYTQYNQISIFAPELAGNWGIAPIPSYNGNDSVASISSGMSMFENSTNKDASWEFMKWATSTNVQTYYAQEIESRLGVSGRWQSANVEALSNSSYPDRDLKTLVEAQKSSIGIPQVPGGYLTGRQIDYAFRAVVNENKNPLEVIFQYTNPINEEITRKRKEFGLDFIEGGKNE